MKKTAILAAGVAMATAAFAIPNTITTYTEEGLPFAPTGFGLLRNIYCSGRISCRYAAIEGISELSYIGRQPNHQALMFSAPAENCAYGRVFVPQVLIDDLPYRLTFSNTVHYAFGYTSECTIGDVRLEHAFCLDRNAALRRIRVVANPSGRKVRARIVQMRNMPRNDRHAKWDALTFDAARGTLNTVKRVAYGKESADVTLEWGAMNAVAFPLNDRPMREFRGKPLPPQDYRYHMEETEPSDDHFFYLVFDRRPDEDLSPARMERAFAVSRRRLADDVKVESDDRPFAAGVGFVPEMSRALEIDGMGAFRASPHYWVWVWDSTVHADKLAMCGGAEEVKRMLRFTKDYGLQFSYGTRFAKLDLEEYCKVDPKSVRERLLPGVALFFVNLLNGYYQATGDAAFRDECLPFARILVERALLAPLDGEPFSRYSCFYPDHGECVDEQDSDWCLINQAVYWQGLCAWNELTGENEREMKAVGEKLVEVFWDAQEGWWCDAYDPDAKVRRRHYPLFGVLNISRFATDLKRDEMRNLAKYAVEHFKMGPFMSMFDRRTFGWMADGNQLGAYYPTTDRYAWNVRNAAGDLAAIREVEETISLHWRVCHYPEGQTCDVMNADPAEYSDELGNKQFFAAKAFLCDALEVHLGIYPTKDGLRLRPMNDGRDFAVRNLRLRGNRLAIRVRGRGTDCRYALNGVPVELKDGLLPWDRFASGDNELVIDVH